MIFCKLGRKAQQILGGAGPCQAYLLVMPLFKTDVSCVSHVSTNLVFLVLCLCKAYNSGIILAKIVAYYSQNYTNILGTSLIIPSQEQYAVLWPILYQHIQRQPTYAKTIRQTIQDRPVLKEC